MFLISLQIFSVGGFLLITSVSLWSLSVRVLNYFLPVVLKLIVSLHCFSYFEIFMQIFENLNWLASGTLFSLLDDVKVPCDLLMVVSVAHCEFQNESQHFSFLCDSRNTNQSVIFFFSWACGNLCYFNTRWSLKLRFLFLLFSSNVFWVSIYAESTVDVLCRMNWINA